MVDSRPYRSELLGRWGLPVVAAWKASKHYD
jgi:hypothetical protein